MPSQTFRAILRAEHWKYRYYVTDVVTDVATMRIFV